MKFLAVMPSIYTPWQEACLNTCKFPIMVVDNTGTNRGVSKSWNMGIDAMDGADWLILVSAAIRFGEPGGLDFIQALEDRPDHIAVEADKVYGWHLIAFNKRVIDKVGKFDEMLFPGYYNDIDYSWRIQLAFKLNHQEPEPLWDKVKVDCWDAGMAHGIRFGAVRVDDIFLHDYLIKKWGSVKQPYKTVPFK